MDFSQRMEVTIMNTCFVTKEEHRVKYKSGGRCSQIEYVLCRRKQLKQIKESKVVMRECVLKLRQMVVCHLKLK